MKKLEVTQLKSEMVNCVEHYLNVYECLLKCAEKFQDSEDWLSLGRMCMLRKAKAKCVRQLKLFEGFLKYTELPGLESMLTLHVDDEEFYAPEQGSYAILMEMLMLIKVLVPLELMLLMIMT